jgi:hypothetical protein
VGVEETLLGWTQQGRPLHPSLTSPINRSLFSSASIKKMDSLRLFRTLPTPARVSKQWPAGRLMLHLENYPRQFATPSRRRTYDSIGLYLQRLRTISFMPLLHYNVHSEFNSLNPSTSLCMALGV